MTINASQIRKARTLLGWTTATLAKRSRVSFVSLVRVQMAPEIQALTGTDLWAIRSAFEHAGVKFTPENGGNARWK